MKYRIALIASVLISTAFVVTPAHAKAWTPTKLRSVTDAAARYYHLSAAETAWVKDAATDIVFEGAAESHGHKLSGSPGGCYGLFQFNSDWKLGKRLAKRWRRVGHDHSHGWRGCRVCSTYRFVRVYAKGGSGAVSRHWAATLGR